MPNLKCEKRDAAGEAKRWLNQSGAYVHHDGGCSGRGGEDEGGTR